MVKALGLFLGVLLAFLLYSQTLQAAVVVSNLSTNSGRIILEEESTVVIRTWRGSTACINGQLLLVEPKLKLIYSSPNNTPDKNSHPKTESPNDQILVYNYRDGESRVEIGPYPAGTEIVLGIKPNNCNTFYKSTDKVHAKVKHNGGGSWSIDWEDLSDLDYNDVYSEVTLVPTAKNKIETDIVAKRAFSAEPTYKLPWPAGVSHKFTTLPGSGEHKNNMSYDIDMRIGDKIVASEMGLVLWVEDGFGPGGCSPGLRNRANVIVIQTGADVNQTYVHLNRDSVKQAQIEVGEIVEQGQWIANAGNSGYVCSSSGTGSHLHLEWQHHCYDLDLAIKKRTLSGSRPSQPTLAWSCPGFSPDSPFGFKFNNDWLDVAKNRDYPSDNSSN